MGEEGRLGKERARKEAEEGKKQGRGRKGGWERATEVGGRLGKERARKGGNLGRERVRKGGGGR